MKIAYINADFDVSIGGNNGASVHWREMISAFCREGHAVWVISPAGEAIAEEGERNQEKAPLPMEPKLPSGVGVNDLADAILLPVLPHRHHFFEYMAMGKPVVASRIGQVEELIVHGETGLLYTMGSVAQLTIALAKLASNTPFYRRLGENARAWVQKERTWENNAQQVAKMASELIKKRSNVAPLA